MTEFPLMAIMKMDIAQAERSVDRMKSKLSEMADITEGNSQKQTQSWGKVGAAITAVSVISAGLLASMVAASPDLATAIDEIKFQFEEVAMVLGDALVPIIEIFIPYIEQLTEKFLELDPEVQQFIAIGIALGAILGPIIGLVSMLSSVLGILMGPIGLVIAGAALLYIAWKNNFGGLRDFTEETVGRLSEVFDGFGSQTKTKFEEIFGKIIELWTIVSPYIEKLVDIFLRVAGPAIEYYGKIWRSTFEAILDVAGHVLDVIIKLFSGDLNGALDSGKAILITWYEWFTGLWTGLIDFIGEVFDNLGISEGLQFVVDIASSVITGFLNALITGWNSFMDLLNIPFNALRDWELLPESIRDVLPDLSNLKMQKFHGGGILPGANGQEYAYLGLAGEEVVTEDDPRHRRNLGLRGIGGGSSGSTNITIQLTQQFYGSVDRFEVASGARQGVNEGIQAIQIQNRGGYSPY